MKKKIYRHNTASIAPKIFKTGIVIHVIISLKLSDESFVIITISNRMIVNKKILTFGAMEYEIYRNEIYYLLLHYLIIQKNLPF